MSDPNPAGTPATAVVAPPALKGRARAIEAARIAAASLVGVELPKVLEIESVHLHEILDNGKVHNFRLGIVLSQKERDRIFVSIPVTPAIEAAEQIGATLPEERKNEYLLDPVVTDDAGTFHAAINLWFGTELKENGNRGTMLVRAMPCKPLLSAIEEFAKLLGEEDVYQETKAKNLLYKANPTTNQQGETVQLTLMMNTLSDFPKELTEITIHGDVDSKGVCTFKASRMPGTWCFGTSPNALARSNRNSDIRGGNIPTMGGNNNGPQSMKVVECLQNTIDEAMKKVFTEKKITQLVVEHVRPNRQASASSARTDILKERLGINPTSTKQVQDAVSNAGAKLGATQPETATANTETSFETIPD